MDNAGLNLLAIERTVYQYSLARFQRLRVAISLQRGDEQEIVRHGILTSIIHYNQLILSIGGRPFNPLEVVMIRQLNLRMDQLITELTAIGRGAQGGQQQVIGPDGDWAHPQ